MHVIGRIAGLSSGIASRIEHSHLAVVALKLFIPGLPAVVRQIRHASGKIVLLNIRLTAAKSRMLFPKTNGFFYKLPQTPVRALFAPLNPGRLIVLAPDIIVASLGIAHLISSVDRRHSLGKQKQHKSIADLSSSKLR